MTAWTDLVKKIYNENKHKKNYKLGMAMKSAKKEYKTMKRTMKKNKTAKMKGGNSPLKPSNFSVGGKK
jgi:hypothetical protein